MYKIIARPSWLRNKSFKKSLRCPSYLTHELTFMNMGMSGELLTMVDLNFQGFDGRDGDPEVFTAWYAGRSPPCASSHSDP